MLYRRWLETVANFANETAVVEVGRSGRRWTFEELNNAAGSHPRPEAGAPKYALWETGRDVEFLLDVIASWKAGEVLCPVELAGSPFLNLPFGSASLEGIVHLKMTSGSTGTPRAILFRAEQLIADVDNIVKTMGLRRTSPNVSAISLAHSYGFSNLVLPLLIDGIPMVVAGSPLPGSIKSALDAVEAPAVLPGVPAMWKAWEATGVLGGESIETGISAGAPMPLKLEEKIHRSYGLKVHSFYGSSECGGIAFDRTDIPRTDPADVGTPLDGVGVQVGEGGRLKVSGEAVGAGYWPDEIGGEETVSELGDGVFLTGDFGEVVEGRVRLTGRLGDLINVAGRKLSPETVESVIDGDGTVSACVVFGVPSRDTGRADEIVVCVCPGEGFELEATRRRAATSLAAWQMPRRWTVETELAPDVRGKISRTKWRNRYLKART